MRAGRLDRLVTLQTRTLTRNAYGEQEETWATLAQVWAEKIDLKGREFVAAQQTSADVSTRWRIRFRDDVTVLNQLLVDGITYDINQVSEIGRREGLELFTQARVP